MRLGRLRLLLSHGATLVGPRNSAGSMSDPRIGAHLGVIPLTRPHLLDRLEPMTSARLALLCTSLCALALFATLAGALGSCAPTAALPAPPDQEVAFAELAGASTVLLGVKEHGPDGSVASPFLVIVDGFDADAFHDHRDAVRRSTATKTAATRSRGAVRGSERFRFSEITLRSTSHGHEVVAIHERTFASGAPLAETLTLHLDGDPLPVDLERGRVLRVDLGAGELQVEQEVGDPLDALERTR